MSDVPLDVHKSWYHRCLRAESALDFYARREHWMSLGEDGPRTSLIAIGDTDKVDGWVVAEKALRK